MLIILASGQKPRPDPGQPRHRPRPGGAGPVAVKRSGRCKKSFGRPLLHDDSRNESDANPGWLDIGTGLLLLSIPERVSAAGSAGRMQPHAAAGRIAPARRANRRLYYWLWLAGRMGQGGPVAGPAGRGSVLLYPLYPPTSLRGREEVGSLRGDEDDNRSLRAVIAMYFSKARPPRPAAHEIQMGTDLFSHAARGCGQGPAGAAVFHLFHSQPLRPAEGIMKNAAVGGPLATFQATLKARRGEARLGDRGLAR